VRILLVDDDFSSISALANLLEYNNTLKIANNGVDALMMFEAERFDVVVTDIKMPKMNGLELLKAIRENDRNTDVILITGHPTDESESAASKLGARKLFAKPLDVKSFMKTLDDIELGKKNAS